MPKIEFEAGFKKKGFTEYNKLSLEKNERARICVIDSPEVEYIHSLSKVRMEDGKPVMKTETFTNKSGTKSREVPDTDYVGRFICQGDFDVLESKNVDPDNCPACKFSIESSAIDGPKRRFAVHVIKYQTKKGSFNIQEPFQIELLAWDFTEARFTTLTDIRNEHGALPGIDLCLGPCDNPMYQKYDILPGGNCQWSQSEERKKITAEVYKSQKYDDLSGMLGRKISPAELRSFCVDVVGAWNIAFGQAGSMPEVAAPAAATALADTTLDGMDLFGDGPTIDTPAAEESSEAPSEPSEDTASDVDSLEALLAGDFK